MATINLTIPDVVLARVLDAITSRYGYKSKIIVPGNPSTTIPNPQSKEQFSKEVLKNFVMDAVKIYESETSADVARKAAWAAAEQQVVIT